MNLVVHISPHLPRLPSMHAATRIVLQLAFSFYLVTKARAVDYTWTFEQEPRQCSDLTLSITGSGGKAPYRVLIVPIGSNPWGNDTDVRQHFEKHFIGKETKLTFNMNYPANSHFVAVVSDARRFGSGGTSVAIPVASSSDTSCFNFKTPLHPFYFFLVPANQLVQCGESRIYWPEDKVKGSPNFVGVIPGGNSFEIPSSNKSAEGGFTWKSAVRGGTTVLIVGGDSRGNGTGGGVENVVNPAPIFDSTCLSDDSPSSTPGNPAGGYPTGGSGGHGGAGAPGIGLIVGVAVGGATLLIVAALLVWWWRRKKSHRRGTRAVLLDRVDDDDEVEHQTWSNKPNGMQQVLSHYSPEPFRLSSQHPDERIALTSYDHGTTVGTPSNTSTWSLTGTSTNRSTEPYAYRPVSGYSGESSARRKAGSPPVSPPVNVIQHDDAGPPPELSGMTTSGTIELPPAYTALKRMQAAANPRGEGSSSGGGTSSELRPYPHTSGR